METNNETDVTNKKVNLPSCYFDVDFDIDNFFGYNAMLKDYCDVDMEGFVDIIKKTGIGDTIFLMGYSYSSGFYIGKILKTKC